MDQTGINRQKIRIQILGLVVSILLMFLKFMAYWITHSNAILTDALESIANVVAGGFAVYSLHFASLPKDENHPYGHGKIEFISAGIEGGLVLIAGGYIIIKSVYNFFEPKDIQEIDTGILLTAISGVINYIMGFILIRKGTLFSSLILVADGKHLISDAISSAGLLVGLVVIYLTGITMLDNIVAAIFGLIIIRSGIQIIKKSLSGILDEADYVLIEEVSQVLNKNRDPNWIDIHNLRIIKYGDALHIDCHLTLPWYSNLRDSYRHTKAIEKLVKEKMHDRLEFFIQSEPCVPSSCHICTKKDCPVRVHPFSEKIDWDLSNMVGKEKHQLKNHPSFLMLK